MHFVPIGSWPTFLIAASSAVTCAASSFATTPSYGWEKKARSGEEMSSSLEGRVRSSRTTEPRAQLTCSATSADETNPADV